MSQRLDDNRLEQSLAAHGLQKRASLKRKPVHQRLIDGDLGKDDLRVTPDAVYNNTLESARPRKTRLAPKSGLRRVGSGSADQLPGISNDQEQSEPSSSGPRQGSAPISDILKSFLNGISYARAGWLKVCEIVHNLSTTTLQERQPMEMRPDSESALSEDLHLPDVGDFRSHEAEEMDVDTGDNTDELSETSAGSRLVESGKHSTPCTSFSSGQCVDNTMEAEGEGEGKGKGKLVEAACGVSIVDEAQIDPSTSFSSHLLVHDEIQAAGAGEEGKGKGKGKEVLVEIACRRMSRDDAHDTSQDVRDNVKPAEAEDSGEKTLAGTAIPLPRTSVPQLETSCPMEQDEEYELLDTFTTSVKPSAAPSDPGQTYTHPLLLPLNADTLSPVSESDGNGSSSGSPPADPGPPPTTVQGLEMNQDTGIFHKMGATVFPRGLQKKFDKPEHRRPAIMTLDTASDVDAMSGTFAVELEELGLVRINLPQVETVKGIGGQPVLIKEAVQLGVEWQRGKASSRAYYQFNIIEDNDDFEILWGHRRLKEERIFLRPSSGQLYVATGKRREDMTEGKQSMVNHSSRKAMLTAAMQMSGGSMTRGRPRDFNSRSKLNNIFKKPTRLCLVIIRQ